MSKYFALGAYVLSIIGALIVLLVRRNDRFAVFHAKQSIGLALAAVVLLLGWGVTAWVLTWIPYLGFTFAMALFALVIAGWLALAVCWIMGMRNALQAREQPLPFIGRTVLNVWK
jgi:uncharacterized membrane protein